MSKIITSICILLITSIGFCLGQTKNQTIIKANDTMKEMSPEHFQKIIKFVLAKGDRQTYCNMYNNSPHYNIENFHIYLNPFNQMINGEKTTLSTKISDYNEIVIFDSNAKERYFHIKLLENNVFFDTKRLKIYLTKIDNEIKK